MKSQIAGLLSTVALFVALSLTPALAQGGPDNSPAAGPQTGDQPEAGGGAGPQSGPAPQAQTPGASDQGVAPGKGEKGKSADQPHEPTGKAAEKPAKPEGKPEEKSTEGKTGDNAADRKSGGAKVEPQQIQKVKTYFTAHKPNVKRVDRSAVSVSIGIAVPGSIGLYALPPDVVVVSGDCPLEYFVWGDDVVLVDSCSREVVEILVGAA